tara:strand:- start:10010 stop:11788 length:1779 start_codon:yes stop_codon:yes gene_type:complete
MKFYLRKFSPLLKEFFKDNYDVEIDSFDFVKTRDDFDGDITMLVFPLQNKVNTDLESLSNEIGSFLVNKVTWVNDFNIVKGFLNLNIFDVFYVNFLKEIDKNPSYGHKSIDNEKGITLVEFSSPNTNKPLHLGHIRNNLLGDSISRILKANGYKTIRTQIINDRGIHICKSMISWLKFAKDSTPKSTGIKPDKFVGNFYVLFEKEYQKQINALVKKGYKKDYAEKKAPIFLEAKEMLQKWESGDEKTIKLWKKMNSWVYEGFDKTYRSLGIEFDKNYYESKTYLKGKKIVENGITRGIFYKKKDNSICVDLTENGLDEKVLIRSDGTSVYITQDIGTAMQRFEDFPEVKGMIYTVGNEQDYHFKTLFLILKKIGIKWTKMLHHLSYGMVDLPDGKMKSREGNVVDADDLMLKMKTTAKKISSKLGKLDGYSKTEKNDLYRKISLGALKYYILKVDPRKTILFDPEKSIDFNGNTGPFIQYTYARIQSILKNNNIDSHSKFPEKLNRKEIAIIKQLILYPEIVEQSLKTLSPAIISNYIYELVKRFNSFYQNVSILGAESIIKKNFRLILLRNVAKNLNNSCKLLGIRLPRRM